MEKIMIHANNSEESTKTKYELFAILKDKGFTLTRNNPDLIIVIGGDGTMLSAIRLYSHLNVPFVGINTGHLGFLSSYLPDNLGILADSIAENTYMTEKHSLIEVNATTVGGQLVSANAFNEIIIKHIQPNLMSAKLYINGKPFNYFTGDGFVISTPIGATGYAIWCGGAAMHSSLDVFQITPLMPNDNSINRPLKSSMILPSTATIDLEIVKAAKRKVIVACDGVNIANEFISKLSIKLASNAVNLLFVDNHDYFQLFKEKIIDKNLSPDERVL